MFRIASSLVARMLVSVAALAILIFVIVGGAELWREHSVMTDELRAKSDSALSLSTGPLSNALWNYDLAGVDTLARSLVREGALVQVQVLGEDGRLLAEVWRDGATQADSLSQRRINLNVPQRDTAIGELRVRESYAEADQRILRRARDRLPLELLKILAVAVSMMLLLHRLVIARVTDLVRQLQALRIDDAQAVIELPPDRGTQPDEIVVLGRAINQFQQDRALEVQRRRMAEEMVRDSLLERSVMLGSLRDGLLALDVHLQVRYANGALADLLDLAERPAPGTSVQGVAEVRRGGVLVDMATWLADLTQPGLSVADQVERIRQDGQLQVLRAQLKPVTGAHDVAWILLLSDVSDVLRSQQAERARALAEAANLAKSEFLSRMSHELRTPLNAIVGFAQTLGSDPQVADDPQRREQVALIERAGWHLSRMISDVLDLSRIEAGHLKLDQKPVDLRAIASDALAFVRDDALREQVSLDSEVRDELRWAMADGVRVQQVLVNLLSNAVKYNRPGGLVHLRVALDGVDQVRFDVTDTGLGMDAQQQAHLFESFNRLGREISGKPGAGIGLVVTRSLITAMQGQLDVHSVAGQGSRFSVRLPMALLEQGPASVEGRAQPALTNQTRRLVYIEDDPVNAMVMEAMLARRDHWQLTICSSLAEGWKVINQQRPDLLLLDMQLGDGMGTDMLARLQADPRLKPLPVIVVSADALDVSIQAAMAAGAQAYITKPLDSDELIQRIEDALTKRLPG
ncbi:hybrid sensor histidine kinase/response regulator [Ideonella margarita]|uniref:histidine kinase n=1 Tax=Ideonella margarita TaxID=2984191 RepID=A0ABU9C576_9BURK